MSCAKRENSMTRRAFEIWDVFTDRRFAGNQLAVVMEAQGLSGADMQAITREFNFAESTFVLPPEDPANTARVRIFTPGYEMPFAGHPTVGTALAIARARGLAGAVRLELKAGVVPVRLGKGFHAEFLNPNPPRETGAAPPARALEAALSLEEGAIDEGAHRPRRIGAGVDFYFAHAPLDAVRRARLRLDAFEALGFDGVIGVLLYARGGDAPDASYHVRMFAPGAGVPEDAATGSAAAALPGQIARSEGLAEGESLWVIEQGVELGRPSRIEARVEARGGEILSVRIGGAAVPVAAGYIEG